MTSGEAARVRAELTSSLMEFGEQLSPILDAADGLRAEMERRGWSPTAGEQASLTWLLGALSLVFQGGAR